jgi:flagellar secretion chaperone FliS
LSTYTPQRSTAAYQQSSVLTASPGRLVVMLYDGAGRFLAQAALAMTEGRHGEANERLRRGELIIDELLCTLNMEEGGVIASRLQGLYVFFLNHLTEARTERDADKITFVAEQMGELRESWAQIGAT